LFNRKVILLDVIDIFFLKNLSIIKEANILELAIVILFLLLLSIFISFGI